MKKLIILISLLFPVIGFSYPNRDSQEFRVVASSTSGIFGDMWAYEGQLISKNILSDKASIGGSFKLGEVESSLGANITYKINRLFSVTVSGDLNQKKDIGGSFWLTSHIDRENITYLPFILVDHQELGSVGVLLYYDVLGVSIHIGVAYNPPFSKHNSHDIAVMIGTSFKDKKAYKTLEGLGDDTSITGN